MRLIPGKEVSGVVRPEVSVRKSAKSCSPGVLTTVPEKLLEGLVKIVPAATELSFTVTTELLGARPVKVAVLSGTVAVIVTESVTSQVVAGKIGEQLPALILVLAVSKTVRLIIKIKDKRLNIP